MNDHPLMTGRAQERRPGRLRRTTARIAVLGLVVGGAIAMTAAAAGADSPNPGSSQGGSAVVNGDGSVTVTVNAATWVWDNQDCNKIDDSKNPGWQVVWGDNDTNLLVDSIFVGDDSAQGNVVQLGTTNCDDSSGDATGTFTGSLTHTYSAAFVAENGIHPCVVTYHVDDKSESGNHSTIAGGANHNTDNSIEENDDSLEDGCVPVTFAPDVKVVKTGPTTATVGTPFAYTITASNTGAVDADDVTITDVIPAGADFVSADPPCAYNSGTRTVTCDVGTLESGESATVHITVTPNQSGTLVNTATVTPNDATPSDNTSTWTIGDVQVAAATAVTGTPKLTG